MKPDINNPQAEKLLAFERLVETYEAPLLRYAARLLRDNDAAQDVVQQAFLRLLRGWHDALEPKIGRAHV